MKKFTLIVATYVVHCFAQDIATTIYTKTKEVATDPKKQNEVKRKFLNIKNKLVA